MRNRILSCIALLFFLGLISGCTSGPGRWINGQRTIVKHREIRAVWVDSWGPGLYTQEQCDELIAWCETYDFNTIIAEVRKVGDAYHQSYLEPAGLDEGSKKAVYPGFDPLGYLADELADRRDIRLEAWLVANRVWKGADDPPRSDPAHVVNEHPEWLLRNREGGTRGEGDSVFLDSSDPAARAWNARVVRELLQRYDVDAIHLDYIRYPGNEWGYGERSLARFAAATGRSDVPEPLDAEFTSWRAAQVTEQVREIRDAIDDVRPSVELTAATIAWGAPDDSKGFYGSGGYVRAQQDWPNWCERRLVDAIYVMHYKREHVAEQAADYRKWFPHFLSFRGPGSAKIVIGQGSYMNAIDDSVTQVQDAIGAGFDGYAIFSYRTPNKGAVDREAFGQAIRDAATPAIQP